MRKREDIYRKMKTQKAQKKKGKEKRE